MDFIFHFSLFNLIPTLLLCLPGHFSLPILVLRSRSEALASPAAPCH